MDYKILIREKVGKWVSGLIKTKGSDAQKKLLKEILNCDNKDFVNFVEEKIAGGLGEIPYHQGHVEVPTLAGSDGKPVIELTPGHMYLMPHDAILAIYEHWKDIPYVAAADSSLWGAITLSEIRAGRINPCWACGRQVW